MSESQKLVHLLREQVNPAFASSNHREVIAFIWGVECHK